MTSSVPIAPLPVSRKMLDHPIGTLALRWLLLVLGVWMLRHLAGVVALQPGDNIADLQPSSVEVALSGLMLAGFTLVAVMGRLSASVPVWLAAAEAAVTGLLVVWPAINSRAMEAFGDMGAFDYRTLVAVWFAGALLAMAGIVRRDGLKIRRPG